MTDQPGGKLLLGLADLSVMPQPSERTQELLLTRDACKKHALEILLINLQSLKGKSKKGVP